jgi:membrane protease YdiL (CAAX protease family)
VLRALQIAAMLSATAAMIAETIAFFGAGRFPIFSLLKKRFCANARTPAEIACGLAAGLAMVALPAALSMAFGSGQFHSSGSLPLFPALLTLAVKFLWAALEELIFRGALLLVLLRRLQWPAAVLLGSAVFSLAHPFPTPWDLADRFVDGLAFSFAFLGSGSLWLPTAWHFGKNAAVWLLFSQSTMQFAPGVTRIEYTSELLPHALYLACAGVLVLTAWLHARPAIRGADPA